MTIKRFCLTIFSSGLILAASILLSLSSRAVAAEANAAPTQTINNYYEITVESLEFLRQRLASETEALIANLPLDVALEDYIAGLSADEYSYLLREYAASLTDERLRELAVGELSDFYNAYIDWLYDDEFAVPFRQYLGELTSEYLVAPPVVESGEGAVALKSFEEFVLQNVLQLPEGAYEYLYRNYIETLWSYYISTASEEELVELLGEDFDDPIASASTAIVDERYFERLADHINSMDEREFIASYRAYVTETIGGIIEHPEVLDALNEEADSDTQPADAQTENDDTGADTDGADVEPTEVASVEAETENITPAAPQIQFFDLTAESSLQLIRQHIASVAMGYFINDFRSELTESPYYFTSQSTMERLGQLATLPDFRELLQAALDDRNATNLQNQNALNALTDDTFLGGVRLRLRFVEDIPYPNLRLLRIAVLQVMQPYRDGSDEIAKLPDEHYQLLLDAIWDSVVQYDENGPIIPPSVSDSDESAAESAAPATGGSVSWDFLGCGCEIDQANVIYGFYPSWDIPLPGSAPQRVDLRFYSRVAYLGFTLDDQGAISDDPNWREGGILNSFIQDAHVRNTRIDLAVYSPTWHQWGGAQVNFAAANIVDKLSIPLQFDLLTRFASNYLRPMFPTYSETIGKDTMGDGLTLYFDNLEDSSGNVRNLETIVSLVTHMDDVLEREFPADVPPINLMLDFNQENTVEVLTQLHSLIVGTETDMNEYVSRVLLFLEQDTWDSSQNLIEAVRTTFKDDDSAAVLRKLNPIIIPAMDENEEFPTLSRDLRDLRWTFGNGGGAAIWPIPLENSEKGIQIENAFTAAMVDDSGGTWESIQRGARSIYFQARLSLIFTMTLIYTLSMIILIWSIREPIRPWILLLAKTLGFLTFTMLILSYIFIDPYMHYMRVIYFLLPIAFVLLVVPLQSSMPDVRVNATGNRYINRGIKRQKSRVMRKLRGGLRRTMRQGWGGEH